MNAVFAIFCLAVTGTAFAAAPVEIILFTESYCPGCMSYETTNVNDAVTAFADSPGVMDFTIVPYGNAQEVGSGPYEFKCQHGDAECLGNMVETCAMHFHSDIAEWWPFVYCLEKGTPATDGEKCAKTAGFGDWDAIEDCTTSSLGNDLMHKNAAQTDALVPPHQWTPWVVMNGTPLSESDLGKTLIDVVCEAYTGTKPDACSSTQEETMKCMRNSTQA